MKHACEGCAWHVRTHYDGTPKNEIYNECEYHCMVLDDEDQRCSHFATERDED